MNEELNLIAKECGVSMSPNLILPARQSLEELANRILETCQIVTGYCNRISVTLSDLEYAIMVLSRAQPTPISSLSNLCLIDFEHKYENPENSQQSCETDSTFSDTEEFSEISSSENSDFEDTSVESHQSVSQEVVHCFGDSFHPISADSNFCVEYQKLAEMNHLMLSTLTIISIIENYCSQFAKTLSLSGNCFMLFHEMLELQLIASFQGSNR